MIDDAPEFITKNLGAITLRDTMHKQKARAKTLQHAFLRRQIDRGG